MKKLTTESFIDKAVAIYGTSYLYDKVVYVDIRSEVTLTCPQHGDFNKQPTRFLAGNGCNECAVIKRKHTNMLKYGTECSAASDVCKSKAQNTLHLNYGISNPSQSREIRAKAEATLQANYGVSNPSHCDEIRAKAEATLHTNYGVSNPSYSNQIRRKVVETNLFRLGVQYPAQSPVVVEKMQSTSLAKYGVTTYSQTTQCKDERRSLMNDRYGVDHWAQRNIRQALQYLESYNWLHFHYVECGHTQHSIALTLNVSAATVGKYMQQHEIPVRISTNYSKKAIRWLNHVSTECNINIRHAESGGEFLIPGTRFRADGYCLETNTVYEFLGNRFHGNLELFDPTNKCHPFDKTITANELFNITMMRLQHIQALGYEVVYVWELDWDIIEIEMLNVDSFK